MILNFFLQYQHSRHQNSHVRALHDLHDVASIEALFNCACVWPNDGSFDFCQHTMAHKQYLPPERLIPSVHLEVSPNVESNVPELAAEQSLSSHVEIPLLRVQEVFNLMSGSFSSPNPQVC